MTKSENPTRIYRNYMLLVLATIQGVISLDRLTLGLVLQNIKADLRLSDTELGVLGGIAFALFYSLVGIPIARWADRGNRVSITAVTTLLWSVSMALCGLAASFVQLLLVRVIIAVGEAGCIPPAQSLIPDYFERSARPRAVSLYMLGGSVAAIVGYPVAGWLNQMYGWRLTFVLIGLPGLVLAALAWLTLREPRHRAGDQALSGTPIGLRETLTILWSSRVFRHLLVAFSVICFFGSGILQWQPAFFIRSFRLTTTQLGGWLAIAFGISGLLGVYAGGALASRYAAQNEHLQLAGIAGLYCAFALLESAIFLVSNKYLALALTGFAAMGAAAVVGPLFATVQTLVPAQTRATAVAILYLFSNLIGLGIGPLLVGVLSDGLRPVFADESLRYALLLMCPGYFWAATHLFLASRSVGSEITKISAENDANAAAPFIGTSA